MVTNNIEEYKGVYVFAQQVDNEISGKDSLTVQ